MTKRTRFLARCVISSVGLGMILSGCFFRMSGPSRFGIVPQQVKVVAENNGEPLDNVTVQVDVEYYCEAFFVSIHSKTIDSYVDGPFRGDAINISNKKYFRPPCLLSGFTVSYAVSAPGYASYRMTDYLPGVIRLKGVFSELPLLTYAITNPTKDLVYNEHVALEQCEELSVPGYHDCHGFVVQIETAADTQVIRILGEAGKVSEAEEFLRRLQLKPWDEGLS